MKISGACFCGEIQYLAVVDPNTVAICHCRDCQIFSGSAFRMSCMANPDEFEFTRGSPRYFDKTADSGKIRRMAFCKNCGTHLCSLPTSGGDGFVSIRLATANEFSALQPVGELYCASRVSWLVPISGAAQFAAMP